MVGLQSRSRCEHPARAGAGRRAVRPRCQSSKSRTGVFRGVVSGFRYYNPSTGRWLSRDPIGDIAAMAILLKHSEPTTLRQIASASWEMRQLIRQNPSYRGRVDSDSFPRETSVCALTYGFNRNDPVDQFDSLGLAPILTVDPTSCCGCVGAIGTGYAKLVRKIQAAYDANADAAPAAIATAVESFMGSSATVRANCNGACCKANGKNGVGGCSLPGGNSISICVSCTASGTYSVGVIAVIECAKTLDYLAGYVQGTAEYQMADWLKGL